MSKLLALYDAVERYLDGRAGDDVTLGALIEAFHAVPRSEYRRLRELAYGEDATEPRLPDAH